jgi:Flp pilus assembly protein TadG
MRRFLPTAIRSIASDLRGVSMIEFGFLAPILAVLLGVIVDLSMGLSHVFTLHQSVNRSLEVVQANRPQQSAQDSDVDFSYLVREAAQAAGVTEDKVTLDRWLECNGVRQSAYTGTCADTADTARYVELRVAKEYKGKMYLKSYPVTARAAVRVQ